MCSRQCQEYQRHQREILEDHTEKKNRVISESERQELLNSNESETGKISINQLNLHCLVQIFSYIPAADRLEIKRVCKKWEEVLEMSWYTVRSIDTKNLSIPMKKKELTLMKLLKNCCRYLTHLRIDYQYPWLSDVLMNNCKNIVHFHINFYSAYSLRFYEIVASMSKLKYLRAAVRAHYNHRIYDQLMGQLPSDIEEIHLVAPNSKEIPEDAPLLNKFTNLRCLTLRGFTLTTATIESILQQKNTLVYLDLYRCHFPKKCQNIFSHLIHLEHLNVSWVRYFTKNFIIEIARNCQKLRYFEYVELDNLRDFLMSRSIFSELKYLVNLEHLDFPFVNKSGDDFNSISDVLNNCKKLKHLNVGHGYNFSPLDFEKITKFENLEYLNLLALVRIDSQSFEKITSNCFELKELKMEFKYLPEADLEKLTNLKKLETLSFEHCDNLTGNLLSKIVNSCKNLVDLNLVSCCNVTQVSLIQVGKLQYLKRLIINEITNVPNAMFNNCCKLESLSCNICPSVTDEGIIKVLDNCPNLSILEVNKTGISVNTLVHAAARRQFAFKVLHIYVDSWVKNDYLYLNRKHSRYLKINENPP